MNNIKLCNTTNGVWVYFADGTYYKLIQKDPIYIKQTESSLIICPIPFKQAKETGKYEKILLFRNKKKWVVKWVYRCDLTLDEASGYELSTDYGVKYSES